MHANTPYYPHVRWWAIETEWQLGLLEPMLMQRQFTDLLGSEVDNYLVGGGILSRFQLFRFECCRV